ncbi:MAG: hypothetical protein ABIV26_05205 [Candidatus Limnocylindrales bacterium]
MNVASDLGRAIGDGITSLVGGAVHALGVAFDTVVTTFQSYLPGPWLPIVVVAVLAAFAAWLFRK